MLKEKSHKGDSISTEMQKIKQAQQMVEINARGTV
jgi:hypothetical protein